jgi:hypothetical protein
MRWRMVLEVVGAEGTMEAHEVGAGERPLHGHTAAMPGLGLAEGKAILAAVQRHLVPAQVDEHCRSRRRCDRCGAQRPLKDVRPRRLTSLFGVVEVRAPRFGPCRCGVACRRSLTPVAEIMPDRSTPEYERVVAAMGAALPYRRALALLGELFPLGDVPALETARRRTLRVGARLERAALAPSQPPAAALAQDAITLGIDAGHVRSVRGYQVRSFEAIVAQVSAAEGKSVVFGGVPAEADRQHRQLRGVLHRLGATQATPVTVLSDGADGPRSLGEVASPGPTRNVLDWFHLAMRIHHAAQAAKGWPADTPDERGDGARLVDAVERIRWRLWHGQARRALDLVGGDAALARRHCGDRPSRRVEGGGAVAWARDLRLRAGRPDHRLRDGTAQRRADLYGDHRECGAVAAAPPDGRQPADALVAAGRASDAAGPHRCRQRHPRRRPCCRRTLGPPAVPLSSIGPPGLRRSLRWFVRRWRTETTFEEARRHLGMETQRQWSDLAIRRTTPAPLGLFSLVTLWAGQLAVERGPAAERVRWYPKPLPTFSDALALVRRELWTARLFAVSPTTGTSPNASAALIDRLLLAACRPP